VRDLPKSLDLLALGRELLLDELLPLLPLGRERDVHLIATAMAIVARETTGEGWQRGILAALSDFYSPSALQGKEGGALLRSNGEGEVGTGERSGIPRLTPALSTPGGGEGVKSDAADLLARLAADLRNGAFETSPSRAAAARAILWRLTIAKLREGNPQFLAANGFGRAGGKGE
jgi:hypothetical protein